MRYIIVTLILLTGAISNAGVYEEDTSQGGVLYTDTPSPNAKPVDSSDETSSISGPPPEARKEGSAKEDQIVANQMYKTFVIVSPKDHDTTQGQSPIPVKMKLEPALHEGDTIQIMIDGKPFGPATTDLNPSLSEVARGVHQLSAVILDARQAIIKQSNSLTLYVHRTSAQTSPALRPLSPAR